MTAYVDGKSIGSQTLTSTLNTISTGVLTVGATTNSGAFDGDLDELAIFPSVLTSAQIAAQYKASGEAAIRTQGRGRPAAARSGAARKLVRTAKPTTGASR